MHDLNALAQALLPVMVRADAVIMQIYGEGFAVTRKADDSPVTQADIESQRLIVAALAQITPGIPVLAEESAAIPWAERRQWRELWVVDPLDGTREFVKRNGEFTVNIALVIEHEPVLGLISAPAQGLLYWGAAGIGAFSQHRGQQCVPLRTRPAQRPLRIVGSRSHPSGETERYLAMHGEHTRAAIGSSLKFCLLAEGAADLYPRFGPTSEWDTAAGQALLEAAGGGVTRLDGHRLRYNCRDSVLNGDFIAFGDPSALPSFTEPRAAP